MTWVVAIAAVVAVTAAIRSTWSPCGASMLSSITPLVERAKGHRYGVTVTWFLLGTVVGGATLGLVGAAGALATTALDPAPEVVAGLVAAAALVVLASDLGVAGFRLPVNPRQVNRAWLDEYRPWVYAGGYGWQLGVGVATYVMTGGVYLVVVLGALTAEPLTAMGLAVGFAVVRGLAILPAGWVRRPSDLVRLHERFERARPASRLVALIGPGAAVTAAAGVLWGPLAAIVAAVAVTSAAWALRAGLRDPLPDPDPTVTRISLGPARPRPA